MKSFKCFETAVLVFQILKILGISQKMENLFKIHPTSDFYLISVHSVIFHINSRNKIFLLDFTRAKQGIFSNKKLLINFILIPISLI